LDLAFATATGSFATPLLAGNEGVSQTIWFGAETTRFDFFSGFGKQRSMVVSVFFRVKFNSLPESFFEPFSQHQSQGITTVVTEAQSLSERK